MRVKCVMLKSLRRRSKKVFIVGLALLATAFFGLAIDFTPVRFITAYTCSNRRILSAIESICADRENLSGTFCDELCNLQLEDVKCFSSHFQKDFVFEATLGNGEKVIAKSFHEAELSQPEASSSKAFTRKVKRDVKSKFLVDLDHKLMKKLRFQSDGDSAFTFKSEAEIRQLHTAIVNKEYFWSRYLEAANLLPKTVGFCGRFYAVERLDVIRPKSPYDVDLALKMLHVVDGFQTETEQLMLCDLKLDNFGLSSEDGGLRLLDADHLEPFEKISSASCSSEKTCKNLLRCERKCDEKSRMCRVTTTNLQLTCKDVFLKWQRDRLPDAAGILQKAPKSILDVVNLCAKTSDSSKAAEIKRDLEELLK